MVLRQRDIHLAESLLDRIHHHVRPADEVLMLAERRRQMALQYFSGYEALLARPAGGWICQYVDDRQIEPRFQRFEFLTEGYRFPVPAAVEQNHGPFIASVGKRADQAHHRRHADAAGDQHVHIRRIAGGERTVRPIEVDALTYRQFMNCAGEVAQIPDRHLYPPIRSIGAGREGERVPGDFEGTSPQRQPTKLARDEAEAGMAIRLHHQRPRVTTFLANFSDAIRPPKQEQWLDNPHVKQQPDPENCQANPQHSLPWVNQIETPAYHVKDSRRDGDNREQDMGDVPGLVSDTQFLTPHSHYHQGDQRVGR